MTTFINSYVDISAYELLDQIGEGTFGKVYKVKNKKTKKIFACKISKSTIEEKSKDEILNLKREVRALTYLNHPSVLKLIGYSPVDFTNTDRPAIITEYLPKGTLKDLIKENKSGLNSELNDTRKLLITYGIASAMSYLHLHGYIHRDLKPGNILMDESLYPVIADFGLAKLINSNDPSQSLEISQSTDSLKGTPPYIPPEIWDGDEYTNAVDVYAFGMIIYELFSNGPPPFENEKYFKICQKVLKGERPPVGPEIPESYQKLIQDCWSQDPSSRPTFDDIIERLKADPGFVSEEVSAVDYLNYIEYVKSHSLICPFEDFIKLDEDTQNTVVQAENEPDLLYYVGEQFLNGTDNFPQNTDLSISYLSNASNKGSIGALKCYCQMLIKGDVIERDIDLAKKYLKPLLSEKDDSIYLLYGYAMIKKPNYKVARKCFLLAIEKGNAEAMYQYGKMLYKGEGIDRDEKAAIEYFEKAKLKGCQKVDTFLDKQNKEESNKNVQNLIDVIFMVDGTFSMKHFINSLTSELGRITQKCHSNHPNDDIMYGAVIYRDTAVSRLLKKQSIEKVDCYDLTSNIKEVVTFFSKSRIYGGGGDGPEDWASGFSCLLNKISWRRKSLKVVIHICDAPGHGRHFTAKKRFYRQVVKIPVISTKNTERQNAYIYNTKIQDRQDRVFFKLVNLAAKKNLMFFCMNGSEKAMGCFQMTRDLFRKKGGKKYLIMNQFNCSYYIDDEGNENEIDMDNLKAKISELSINAVDIAIKANSSNDADNDNDNDNDEDEFEVNCREDFEEKLKEYEERFSKFDDTSSDDSVLSFPNNNNNKVKTDPNQISLSDSSDSDYDDNSNSEEEEEAIPRSPKKFNERGAHNDRGRGGNGYDSNRGRHDNRRYVGSRGGSNNQRGGYRGRGGHRGRGTNFRTYHRNDD